MCILLLTPNCKNLIKHITVSFLKVRNGKDLIPKYFFRIFDHTILRIMNYDAEIWGGNEWSALEKLHLLACKYILGVPQSSPTDGIYAELERHPIFIQRKILIVKYLKRLKELRDETLAKKPTNNSSKITMMDNITGYLLQVLPFMDEYTLDIADSLETTKSKIVSAINNILPQRLADCIDQRKKLRTYATFKTDIRSENYLDFVLNFKVRRCYSQFRLGVHDLEIERGRYRPKPSPIAERLCKLCSIQAVEDEKHFLVECSLHRKQRKRLYEKLADMHYEY